MPEQDYWESLFDVRGILDALAVNEGMSDVAEVGCGYGTFSVPVAQRIRGTLHTYDIEPAMVDLTRSRLRQAGLSNGIVVLRDVIADGFALRAGSLDAVLLFNILHAEQPVRMLQAAAQLLRRGGRVLVIHWRSDIETPRGPDLSIRPRPEQIAAWAAETGELQVEAPPRIVLPWHFVISFNRVTVAPLERQPG